MFYLRGRVARTGPRTISNGTARRDSAGSIETDVQWRKVQITYTVQITREDKDNLYNLWVDSDPVITGASATNAFSFWDEELLTTWTDCTMLSTEFDLGERLKGLQEGYRLSFTIECSASDYNTNKRTL